MVKGIGWRKRLWYWSMLYEHGGLMATMCILYGGERRWVTERTTLHLYYIEYVFQCHICSAMYKLPVLTPLQKAWQSLRRRLERGWTLVRAHSSWVWSMSIFRVSVRSFSSIKAHNLNTTKCPLPPAPSHQTCWAILSGVCYFSGQKKSAWHRWKNTNFRVGNLDSYLSYIFNVAMCHLVSLHWNFKSSTVD